LFGLARFKTKNYEATALEGWTPWFYQWAFAATATTIPAGAVAERFNFNAYLGTWVFTQDAEAKRISVEPTMRSNWPSSSVSNLLLL
jgi:hypothetical protein